MQKRISELGGVCVAALSGAYVGVSVVLFCGCRCWFFLIPIGLWRCEGLSGPFLGFACVLLFGCDCLFVPTSDCFDSARIIPQIAHTV